MSVINQMLNDLQQREQPIKQLPLQAVRYKNKPLFFYFIILLIIILFIFVYFKMSKTEPEVSHLLIQNVKPVNKTPFLSSQTDEVILKSDVSLNEAEVTKTPLDPITEINLKDLPDSSQKPVELAQKDLSNKLIKEEMPTLKSSTETQQEYIKPKKSNVNKSANLPSNNITESEIKKPSIETILNNQLEQIKNDFAYVGYQSTKQALQKLLVANPDLHSARLYFILLSWQQQELDTAEIINAAIGLYPNQSAFRLAAAKYFLEKSDYLQAENSLLNILPTASNLAELLQMRAVIRQKNNKHQLAVNDYTAILQQSPERGDIYIALGISLEALNKNSQALLSYKKAELDQSLSKRQMQFVKRKILFFSQENNNSQSSQG